MGPRSAISDDTGLAQYLRHVRKFPMLKEAEEHALAKRWRESGDRTAAEGLVTSYLRLVARMATQYRGYHVPLSELASVPSD